MMSPRLLLSLMLLVTAGILSTVASAADGDMPRLKLAVGQQLHYTGSSDFKYEHGEMSHKYDWLISVLGKDSQQDYRLLVQQGTESQHLRTGSTPGGLGDKRTDVAVMSIDSSGKITSPAERFSRVGLSGIIPSLPRDEKQLHLGWTVHGTADDQELHYSIVPNKTKDNSSLEITMVRTSSLDPIYLSTNETLFQFDQSRGLATKITGKNSRGWGSIGAGTSTTELKDVKQLPADQIAQLSKDFDVYARVTKEVSTLNEQAAKAEKNSDLLDKAEQALAAATKQVHSELARQLLDERIKTQQAARSEYAESAAQKAKAMALPPVMWELTDFDGKKHALADYKGKVVVLDFWYRGCGWCIRAMPQIKQVAEHFKKRPVAVLGMNRDLKDEDAKFVIDKLKLNYPTLKAPELPEQYLVQGFPTLVVLDQQGKVRRYEVGYSPTLREDLTKAIDELLAENQPPVKK